MANRNPPPVGLVALLLLMAGCASAPQPSPDLGVDVPESWSAAPQVAAEQPRAAGGWWTAFGDARLEEWVKRVLENNRDLAAAAARVEAAAAQARIAGASIWPQIDLGLTPSRGRQNFIGFPIPGSEGRVLSTTTTTFGAQLNVSWEADLWGRLRAVQSAAVARLEASQVELEGARLSLAAQTAKAWFALLEANEQRELARETTESRNATRSRIARRYELGLRTALDLRLAMSNATAAEALLALRERQLDGVRRQLQILASSYPDALIEVGSEPLTLPEPPGPIPAGLPSEILTRRPDLVAAEHRLAATGLEIKQARAALYPQLRLTGSAGRRSKELEDLLETDFSVWSLAANLLQPLFQGGRLRSGVDLAEARYRESAESYLQAVVRAFGEVEGLLAAEGYLSQQEAALRATAEHSAAAQRLAEERYDAGLEDVLAVLEAQRQALTAQSQYLDVRRQRLDARVDLYLALGGDFGGPPIPATLPPSSNQPSPTVSATATSVSITEESLP